MKTDVCGRKKRSKENRTTGAINPRFLLSSAFDAFFSSTFHASHYVQLLHLSESVYPPPILCVDFVSLIVTASCLFVDGRVGLDGGVLAVSELGVGLEGLLGLVWEECVSKSRCR